MKKIGVRLSIGLIIVSLLPFIYIQIKIHSHNWNPLRSPVRLLAGDKVSSSDFTADLDGVYVVSLDFSPTNSPLEECLVGDRLFKDDCKSLGSGLDLSWSVFGRDSTGVSTLLISAPYQPHGFGGAGSVEIELGRFEAHRGGHYYVLLDVREIAPELKLASPILRVEAHQIYWEKWPILAQASVLFALIFGTIGLVILVWAIRSRHNQGLT